MMDRSEGEGDEEGCGESTREKERDESVFTFGNGLTEGYFFRTSRSFSWYILKSKAKFKK